MRIRRWAALAAAVLLLNVADVGAAWAADPNTAPTAREIRRRVRSTQSTPPQSAAPQAVAPASPGQQHQPVTGAPGQPVVPVQPVAVPSQEGAGAGRAASGLPRVALEIGTPSEVWGTVVIELEQSRAPLSVQNFLNYVDSGFYAGVIFHRVLPGFVVQTGGYTGPSEKKMAGLRPPVRNESKTGLKNTRGTVAMARNRLPQSATSQFFVNLKDNPGCDWDCHAGDGWGYCAFGRVVSGMEVIERIATLPCRPQPELRSEISLPVNPPQIRRAYRMAPEPAAPAGRAAAAPRSVPRRPGPVPTPPQARPGEESGEAQPIPQPYPPVEGQPIEEPPMPVEPVPQIPPPDIQPGEEQPPVEIDPELEKHDEAPPPVPVPPPHAPQMPQHVPIQYSRM